MLTRFYRRAKPRACAFLRGIRTASNPQRLSACEEEQRFYEANAKRGIDWDGVRETELAREVVMLREMTTSYDETAILGVNLATVRQKMQQWREQLPRVEPYYAIKCNPDPRILAQLAALGTGFDCASSVEIDAAVAAGAKAQHVIYANPCKQPQQIEHARAAGVRLMTFDNASELVKIAQLYPDAELILRIEVDDSKSVCRMGSKYGASMPAVPGLLRVAKDLGLAVRGVSYHVGSGCSSSDAFSAAVVRARAAFDLAADEGFTPDILDIGGGFPGEFRPDDASSGASFCDMSRAISTAIDTHFADGTRVLAEPGRFFAASACTMATRVFARREPVGAKIALNTEAMRIDAEPGPGYMYYINEGVYSSFNCVVYDHVQLSKSNPPMTLAEPWNDSMATTHRCSIWGPTCDGFDCVMSDAELPLLSVGDWLLFQNMGAYTSAAGSTFNGFARARVAYLD